MWNKILKLISLPKGISAQVTSKLITAFAVLALLAPTSVLLLLGRAEAAAGINEQINFQARLLNASGSLIADGNYNVRFKLYQDGDGDLGGGDETLLWTETRTGGNQVPVANGYLSVQLGSVTAFDNDVDWNQDTIWLSIDIGGTSGTPSWDGEMDPFIRLTSTPYALNAKNLGGRTSDEFVQLDPGGTAQSVDTADPVIYFDQAGAGDLIDLQASSSSVFVVDNTGAITSGIWNGTTIADGYVDNDLTISSSGSVDSTALTDGGTISFDWVDDEIADALTISGGTIDNTVIGGSTPAAASFTTISASSTASFADGTAGAPSIRFTSDTDTGIYRAGADSLAISVSGAAILDVDSVGLNLDTSGTAKAITGVDEVQAEDGSATDPSFTFTSDTNTGIFRIGADNLGIAAGGSEIVDIATTGVDITGALTASGTITLSGLDCTGNTNGGALTADASGVVSCSDDDGGGGSVNSFETISTSSGTSPVADSSTDTLTLTGGTGITVTGDSSTDTITLAATLGTDIDKSEITNSGTLSFDWDDSEVADDLTIATSNSITINNSGGIDINPGSDTDSDLITVGVTGSPTLSWNETNDTFESTNGILLANNAAIEGKETGGTSRIILRVDGSDYAQVGNNNLSLLLKSDGFAGVGTGSPTAALHITGDHDGTPEATGVQISDTNGTYGAIELTGTSGSHIDFQNDTSGTDYDARLILISDDLLRVNGADLYVADGDISAQTGSESEPSYYWASDTDTGIYHSGTNEISLTTAGSDALTLQSDQDAIFQADIYGKYVNNDYSSLYRWGGLYFTWDSNSYGTNVHHSIRSTDGNTYGDNITLNSYGNIRLNFDSNNNDTSYFALGHNTTGNGNEVFTIDESGSPYSTGLNLSGLGYYLCWDNSGGSYIGDCTSLRSEKKNITDLDLGLNEVLDLRPVTFNWRNPGADQRRDLGFIAEETASVNSLLATYDDEGILQGVKYPNLTSLLTNAIQDVVSVVDPTDAINRNRPSISISSNGNVGIGTENPGNKLQVEGNLKAEKLIGERLVIDENVYIGNKLTVAGNVNVEGTIYQKGNRVLDESDLDQLSNGEERQEFTPTLAATINPSLGTNNNGAIRKGFWTCTNNEVTAYLYWKFADSGAVNEGQGVYKFNPGSDGLPKIDADVSQYNMPLGSGYVDDENDRQSVIPTASGSNIEFLLNGQNKVKHQTPYIFGHGDVLSMQITYPTGSCHE